MELRLENGDYVKSGGHTLESVSGTEELAQRLMLRLRARRGGFALRPDYGSRLYTLSGLRPSERENSARAFVAEALSGEDACLEDLALAETESGITVDMVLRCGGGTVSISTEI
jgi:hypothetical protein